MRAYILKFEVTTPKKKLSAVSSLGHFIISDLQGTETSQTQIREE